MIHLISDQVSQSHVSIADIRIQKPEKFNDGWFGVQRNSESH